MTPAIKHPTLEVKAKTESPIMPKFWQDTILKRFANRVSLDIEADKKGSKFMSTRIQNYVVTLAYSISDRVTLERLSAEVGGGYSKGDSLILFNLLEYSAKHRLTTKLQVRNFLNSKK